MLKNIQHIVKQVVKRKEEEKDRKHELSTQALLRRRNILQNKQRVSVF